MAATKQNLLEIDVDKLSEELGLNMNPSEEYSNIKRNAREVILKEQEKTQSQLSKFIEKGNLPAQGMFSKEKLWASVVEPNVTEVSDGKFKSDQFFWLDDDLSSVFLRYGVPDHESPVPGLDDFMTKRSGIKYSRKIYKMIWKKYFDEMEG